MGLNYEDHRWLVINALKKLKIGDYEKLDCGLVNMLSDDLERVYIETGRKNVFDRLVDKATLETLRTEVQTLKNELDALKRGVI